MDSFSNRNDFVNVLFCAGEGLTLNQIQRLEDYIAETFPDGLMRDIEREYSGECTEEEMRNMAMCMGYDVFYMNMRDCTDLLLLREFLANCGVNATDMQVYRLFYSRR